MGQTGAKGFVGPNTKEQVQLINTAVSNSVRLQQLSHFATQQIPCHSRNRQEHCLIHNSSLQHSMTKCEDRAATEFNHRAVSSSHTGELEENFAVGTATINRQFYIFYCVSRTARTCNTEEATVSQETPNITAQ